MELHQPLNIDLQQEYSPTSQRSSESENSQIVDPEVQEALDFDQFVANLVTQSKGKKGEELRGELEEIIEKDGGGDADLTEAKMLGSRTISRFTTSLHSTFISGARNLLVPTTEHEGLSERD